MRQKKNKKLYIVGKNYGNETGGPAGIIRGLVSSLKQKRINVRELCINEHFGKKQLIKSLLKILFCEKNCIINVHTDGIMLPYLVYLFSVFDRRNRYYLTVHGLYCIESEINNTKKNRLVRKEKKLCKRFPNIICVSELLKQTILERFQRKKNTLVVPNGIDLSKIETKRVESEEKADPIKMVMLGGLRARKGIDESIDVIKTLRDGGQDVVLDVYGVSDNDESYQNFETKVSSLELQNYVTYHGNLSDKKSVYQVLANADFHMCLSKWDTFNVAIVESLAIGTPCISSNMCGACVAIKENVNGIVVDLQDVSYLEVIRQYVIKFMKNEFHERTETAFLASEIQQMYTWTTVINEYLKAVGYSVSDGEN